MITEEIYSQIVDNLKHNRNIAAITIVKNTLLWSLGDAKELCDCIKENLEVERQNAFEEGVKDTLAKAPPIFNPSEMFISELIEWLGNKIVGNKDNPERANLYILELAHILQVVTWEG